MEMTYGAILKYRRNNNGLKMRKFRYEPCGTKEDYRLFIRKYRRTYKTLIAPAEEKEFHAMLGLYPAKEIMPPGKGKAEGS